MVKIKRRKNGEGGLILVRGYLHSVYDRRVYAYMVYKYTGCEDITASDPASHPIWAAKIRQIYSNDAISKRLHVFFLNVLNMPAAKEAEFGNIRPQF